MKRSLSRRRLLGGATALLALFAVSVLLGPRVVRAFTLSNNVIYFDAISVPVGHTLHVHVVNQFGTAAMNFRPLLKPTTPTAGSSVVALIVYGRRIRGSRRSYAPPPRVKLAGPGRL